MIYCYVICDKVWEDLVVFVWGEVIGGNEVCNVGFEVMCSIFKYWDMVDEVSDESFFVSDLLVVNCFI